MRLGVLSFNHLPATCQAAPSKYKKRTVFLFLGRFRAFFCLFYRIAYLLAICSGSGSMMSSMWQFNAWATLCS
jgi:hypothetical protein